MPLKEITDWVKLFAFLLSPQTIFVQCFSNGLGDNLLLSAILPPLRGKYPKHKIIVESKRWPQLFKNNPYVDWVTNKHFKTTKRHIKPKYRITQNTENSIYEQIADHIGLKEKLFPELYIEPSEIPNIESKDYIAFCPCGKRGFSANRKEWGLENFQKVIDNLSLEIDFVQVGLESDPLLKNVVDMRKLSIRETAGLIKNARLFLGLEGGLMHVAKAVDTPAVIIYGGAVDPKFSGYEENENIYIKLDCSPCFTSEKPLENCPHKKCMKLISPEIVVDKIKNKIRESYENRSFHW